MRALDIKLLRDLRRLWAQALAIALVMAAGVTTIVLAVGAHASLERTRTAYYERNRFADIFATVTRAPRWVADEAARISGVAGVEARISKLALLDVPGMREPASGLFVSLPDLVPQALSRLTLRTGRLPEPADSREVVVSEPFARAHGFRPGDGFEAILNGRKQRLVIVGVALSPEFIYALGPWDLMPDDRRFGIIWMSEKALAAAYDLTGAFSSLQVKLLPGASERAVIQALDALLQPYGGRGAHGRKDQTSHAFLDAELQQLSAMSRILPPIFLIVAAFLVNMTLGRMIALERSEIGLLKAVGYSGMAIGMHYIKFVAAIALVGLVIGGIAGTWLGAGMARLYADFFHFPFLIFDKDPTTYLAAGLITLAAALVGAIRAVREVVRLPPAVAMSPPAPPRYSAGLGALLRGRVPQSLVMVIRHLTHAPLRSLAGILGTALAVSVLVGSLWVFGATEFMIDFTFQRAERQDATVSFTHELPPRAAFEVARLPGVTAAEPYRTIGTKIRHGHVERRVAIFGKPARPELSRVLDLDMVPQVIEGEGITLSEALAGILQARIGDRVEIELLERDRRIVMLPVSGIIQGYLGLMAYMDLGAANRLMREGDRISGVHIRFDPAETDALFRRVKAIPQANFVALQRVSMQKFRETLAQNILVMISVYVTLATIIAFGVVYNFSRISLSEQARELASLRVLGFSRAEVSSILLAELAIVVLVAQPLGWLIGYGFAAAMVAGFQNELYRMPLVMERAVFAEASLIVLGAAAVSAFVVRRRIDNLDLIEVLKTRE